jgi:hypothetical protein
MLAVLLTPHAWFLRSKLDHRSYLGEFETEFKKALAVNQGPRGYCLMKKPEGRKSCDTVPLMQANVDGWGLYMHECHVELPRKGMVNAWCAHLPIVLHTLIIRYCILLLNKYNVEYSSCVLMNTFFYWERCFQYAWYDFLTTTGLWNRWGIQRPATSLLAVILLRIAEATAFTPY